MNTDLFSPYIDEGLRIAQQVLSTPYTYMQIGIVFLVYLVAYFVARKIRNSIGITHNTPADTAHPLHKLAFRLGGIIYPLVSITLLRISTEISGHTAHSAWVINSAYFIAVLLFFHFCIKAFVTNRFAANLFRWVGLPTLILHLLGYLPNFISELEEISLDVGNVSVSAYGVLRVLIFGTLLFWLGRASSSLGKDIIRKQEHLDVPTREVFSKLFEVALFCVVCLLLLNVMGINLTTLAVFGGAVGVGLGLGLQSIASNFISGIIILLDRSLTVGDYVELDENTKGFVREFRMRYAVLETYDGKDIVVPNEMFISSQFINWTHKDPKQRYRVDFSVPYATDVRAMVEIIKVLVAEHPQVISGEDVPFEERPDCEIDSFGDSGINMFVEFWMQGVDDGKNRVGGDLMLSILETLKAHDIHMPFPQREVTILNPDMIKNSVSK
jgi:small-conductance mechanosensitive channel